MNKSSGMSTKTFFMITAVGVWFKSTVSRRDSSLKQEPVLGLNYFMHIIIILFPSLSSSPSHALS